MNKKLSDIIILCESGADCPLSLVKKFNIAVVPMHVIFEDEDLNDGYFSVTKIIDYYNRTKQIPKTSATNVGEYMNAYNKLHQLYPDKIILHLCYSAVTTATYQNAIIASEGLDYVIHFDTKFVSGGQAFVVYKAAKYIAEHPENEIKDIIDYLSSLIDRIHMSFIPRNLNFLKAGGRVSNAAFLGANVLGVRPMIELLDGQLICSHKYRGRDYLRTCKRMIKDMVQKYTTDYQDVFLISTTGLSEEIKMSIERYIKELSFKSIHWIQAGGVITTHGGPAGFGFVFCHNE